MKTYVASSWRNQTQPLVVERLRQEGHQVYDFRNPGQDSDPADDGFRWQYIDSNWEKWTISQFIAAMDHPLSQEAFEKDMSALMNAELLVLVMPCGRSAHLEMGYAVGSGIPAVILMSDDEPELMYKMASAFAHNLDELVQWIEGYGNV